MNHAQRRALPLLVALISGVAAVAGCASANSTKAAQAGTNTTLPAAPTLAELRAAVVEALNANRDLTVRVLWTNHVPVSATRSTRGPALAALHRSAAQREKQRVRVRMLHQTFQVASIRLNAQRTIATSVVRWDQTVAPSHLDGVRMGRAITGDEHASVVLHRIGSSRSFVVWKVDLIK